MKIDASDVPFTEAIEHLRRKLNLPTQFFDELRGAAHAHAFTVAGATKMALLSDLHDSLTDALANGRTLNDWKQNDFKPAVERHGWSFKGDVSRRAATIYNTNMRTARSAGHWQQAWRLRKHRPYLQYLTAGDHRVRPQHRLWDKLVLPIKDTFWDTHWPPNGWGCRCTVRSLSKSQLERQGLTVDTPPEIKREARVNPRTGEVYPDTPEGIDTLWDYNVGKAYLGPPIALGEHLVKAPTTLRKAFDAQLPEWAQSQLPAWQASVNKIIHERRGEGKAHALGYLPAEVVDLIKPQNALIVMTDKEIAHARRVKKTKPMSDENLLNLPLLVTTPRAVLEELQTGSLMLIIDELDNSGDINKLVVLLNVKKKGDIYNSVRTVTRLPLEPLRNPGTYRLLWGKL